MGAVLQQIVGIGDEDLEPLQSPQMGYGDWEPQGPSRGSPAAAESVNSTWPQTFLRALRP